LRVNEHVWRRCVGRAVWCDGPVTYAVWTYTVSAVGRTGGIGNRRVADTWMGRPFSMGGFYKSRVTKHQSHSLRIQ
jgi:hypothetical protein